MNLTDILEKLGALILSATAGATAAVVGGLLLILVRVLGSTRRRKQFFRLRRSLREHRVMGYRDLLGHLLNDPPESSRGDDTARRRVTAGHR